MPRSDFTAEMLSPCGMNCAVCYKHLGKKPCGGCGAGGGEKPAHCRDCRIRDCAESQGVRLCLACGAFPCKRIRALDRSYQVRYGVSLIENSREIQRLGPAAFQEAQRRRHTCPACGGVISLHDGICARCGAQYPMGRSLVK